MYRVRVLFKKKIAIYMYVYVRRFNISGHSALVHVTYYTWNTNAANFRRFPPSSWIAISIPRLVRHIFNFHHVSRFLLQGCRGFF